MQKIILLFSCAAALNLASCTPDKTTDTSTTTVVTDSTTTAATDTAAAGTTATTTQYDTTTQVIDPATIKDPAKAAQVRAAYQKRDRRIQDVRTRYTTDTVGQHAAVRNVTLETNSEVRNILDGSAQPQAYTAEGSGTATQAAPAHRRGPAIVKYERDGGKVKIEYANGTKVKIDKDGERKTKRANGTKIKVDEDGERKVKD
ncbi:T-complex 10 C-terminal domain-containing protein [Hymenobacter jejuensis]|uniref:Centromere protein J C-terminal domain-containing protein n=1 Tax=Hymenobacter jejuensis TaxID=2502781 RepID=A0A5B8A189_9BACT|nr:T-complex 10 C-terminal domain-containing protein [Hymenobacter jejuensis]QDA60473.1 hypothetical protein FHG12_10285 [Hymenobacter jejuensis]